MRRVIVLGTGHLGRLVADCASRLPGVEAQIASHREDSPLRVDFTDPATFPVLSDFQIAVDCADASTIDPTALIEHCLGGGISFIEASSDSAVIHRLAERFRSRPAMNGARLILGVGIFPGVSTLLMAAAVRAIGSDGSIDLGIRVSPFSGAGKGTSDLMAQFLVWNATRYEHTTVVEMPPVSRAGKMRFSSGFHNTVYVNLPDSEIAAHLWSPAETSTQMAFNPGLITALLPRLAATMGALPDASKDAVRKAMASVFKLLRGRLLKNKTTRVELSVRISSSGETYYTTMEVSDGMGAAAAAICACFDDLTTGADKSSAVFLSEISTLNLCLERMRAAAQDSLKINGPQITRE